MPASRFGVSHSLYQGFSVCFRCQARTFRAAAIAANSGSTQPTPPVPSTRAAPNRLPPIPQREHGAKEWTPKPLNRPIGVWKPPRAGENTGRRRFWEVSFQERDQELRKDLVRRFSKSHFQDWVDLRHHKGKVFVGTPKVFKASHSLYFPNLHGKLLARNSDVQDTTLLFKNKLSVVALGCSRWAGDQLESFIGKKANPELHAAITGIPHAQIVKINFERDLLRSIVLSLCKPYIRKQLTPEEQARYLIVTKGFNPDLKEALGILNQVVGYVYLVDRQCRIRWAASGDATENEKMHLLRALQRLHAEVLEGKDSPSAAPQMLEKAGFSKVAAVAAA